MTQAILRTNEYSTKLGNFRSSEAVDPVSENVPAQVISVAFAADLPLHGGFRDLKDIISERESTAEGAAALAKARMRLAEQLIGAEPDSLAALRLSRGLSQAKLAAAIGTSQPCIAMIESGKRIPQADNLLNLSVVLGVSVDQILALLNIKPTVKVVA